MPVKAMDVSSVGLDIYFKLVNYCLIMGSMTIDLLQLDSG